MKFKYHTVYSGAEGGLYMKVQLILTTGLCLLFVGLFLVNFVDTVSSQEEYYEISITDKNYEKIKTNDIHNIINYNISITLENSGTIESDDITVRIMDEDGNYTHNGTILPGVSKTFLFSNHPLFGLNDHTISVYFYPTDEFVTLNEYNHGEDTLLLEYDLNGSDGNTPGFEAVFVILIISLFVMIKKYTK